MSLDTWVMIGSWGFLDQFEVNEFLDKVEEADVTHLAFGGTPPMLPDPRHYKESVVKGQEPPPEIMRYEGGVRSLLSAAKDRGMQIYFYGTNPHMSGVPEIYTHIHSKRFLDVDCSVQGVKSYWGACANGREFLPYYLGRIMDAHQNFPEVTGFLNDGPEFGYEIAPDFMDNNWSLFACFGECCERKAGELDYDFDAFRTAAVKLMKWFFSLDAEGLQRMIAQPGESLPALADAVGDLRVVDWFNFKRDSITTYIKELSQGIKRVDASLNIGVGSRLPAFTPLTGYDLNRLSQYADFMLPKLYLWMGGVDGLYGTAYRWVKTLRMWNPHLPESILFQFVYKLFGFTLPDVSTLKDIAKYIDAEHLDTTGFTRLGTAFPRRFLAETVADQVRKMISQVGDAGCVRPWLDTDHGGRELMPDELDQLLTAAEGAGLRTYLYYCPLGDEHWEVAVKHGRKG